MSKFLQSGRRRDICAILAGESLQAQALKSRLESHYDTRIEPKSFYGALDALESAGFVETETEGIHDVYQLTEAGEHRLREHIDWLLETVDHEHHTQ
ncbi:PadR family transcriptional regulator [Halobacteriaceae archaeon SHR40]|uniref:PadR family transcriptional regulator n=1 Tax=Halovenus amylolytica TaxID=2500550 RepID=UPI000FE2FF18